MNTEPQFKENLHKMKQPTIEELEEQTKVNASRIRYMKRMRALNGLRIAMKVLSKEEQITQMPNDEDLRKVYKASLDVVAQFRAMFKPHKFKVLDGKE
jgi:hypothetical protein